MTPNPIAIDRLTRTSNVSLSQLRGVIPKSALDLAPYRAVGALLLRLAIIAGSLWGLTVAPGYLYPILWFIQGLSLIHI